MTTKQSIWHLHARRPHRPIVPAIPTTLSTVIRAMPGMSIIVGIAVIVLSIARPAHAQQGGQPPMPTGTDTTMQDMPGMSMDEPSQQDMAAMGHAMHPGTGMHDMQHMMGHGMMAPGPLGQPMERSGSGTSWLPDASPMYAAHRMLDGWTVMLHGQAFLQYDDQGSTRGGDQLGSINWGMAMATHDFGVRTRDSTPTSRLTLRTMLSLDPVTVTLRGYPLLLQTGESYNGVPLHDRQHPHDLFMEVAAMYDQQLTRNLGIELYAAPAGEPASGPVAFMHRPSAINDPFAPISHHWQDGTHITYGVLTAGLFTKTVKLEGSWFNGREPDQDRYDFDIRRLDSYTGRLTVNPNVHWSLEGSYAFLKSPEELTPDVSQHRMTAAALYGRQVGVEGDWSTSIIYGANKYSDSPTLSNSGLIESNLTLNSHNAIFGRAELVQKSAGDLALPDSTSPAAATQQFNVAAFSLGYIRELLTGAAGSLGLGAQGTVNLVPDALRPYYGTRTPLGLGIFFRYRPREMRTMMAHKV
ncbi:MAG TPA: hypothetical protein VNU46_06475 [Gemmatimonadaceae bacterium]|jgi:hypothetical protein|nr:hypothetical protein [Gemmatimonadaceae bacterium]